MDALNYGVVPRDTLASEDGLTFIRGMMEGRHPAPPICRTLDFAFVEASPGRVVFEGRPGHGHLNPIGSVHGGWAATLLDSALGCCIHTALAAGEGYTTIEMKVNYVRPIQPETGLVRCEGTVIHRGATIATSDARLVDGKGKLLAHATETCLIFPLAPKKG